MSPICHLYGTRWDVSLVYEVIVQLYGSSTNCNNILYREVKSSWCIENLVCLLLCVPFAVDTSGKNILISMNRCKPTLCIIQLLRRNVVKGSFQMKNKQKTSWCSSVIWVLKIQYVTSSCRLTTMELPTSNIYKCVVKKASSRHNG